LYHRCATKEEFIYSLNRWKTKSFHKKYPLLYLAFHGERGIIKIGKEEFSLDELAEILGQKCNNVVIYFGSCETLKLDNRLLQNFMEKTGIVALLGYKKEVDWLTSASFEIILLSFLMKHPFDTVGVKKIKSEIDINCRSFIKNLDFRMVLNQRKRFRRKRQ
jgi:hypothetical protein